MTDEQMRRLGAIYEEIMALRSDDEYAVNPTQLQKLVDVINFFLDIKEKDEDEDMKVDVSESSPKYEHGGVTVSFWAFDICGDDIQRFCNVIRYTSALSIDATTEGFVRLSVTIPNVFVPVNEGDENPKILN